MKRVILETGQPGDPSLSAAFTAACINDCLNRGESPIQAIAFHPANLYRLPPAGIERAIAAGRAWFAVADALVVYGDHGLGLSSRQSFVTADALGVPVEFRRLEPKAS